MNKKPLKERYVSFEIAKILRKKGFDGLCSAYYDCFTTDNLHEGNEPTNFNEIDPKIRDIVSAPTLQMACEWLREKHKLYIEPFVIKNYDKKELEYTYTIQDLDFPGSDDGIECCKSWNSSELAVEAAVKYCIEKLI